MLFLGFDLSVDRFVGLELVVLGLWRGEIIRFWFPNSVHVDFRVEVVRRDLEACLAVDVLFGLQKVLRPAHLQRQGGSLRGNWAVGARVGGGYNQERGSGAEGGQQDEQWCDAGVNKGGPPSLRVWY